MEENKEKVENKEESVKEAEVVTNNETVQEKKVNSYALASFICSLVGLLVCGLPLGIAAVITGGYALNSYKEEKENGNLKDYSIVVVKFVSQYHGTYFVKGKVTNLSTQQVTEYSNKDLSQNMTRDFVSLGRNKVRRPGFGNTLENNESVNLTVNPDGSVNIEAGGSVAITDASATLDPAAESLEFVGKQPKFTLSYKYTKGGVTYQVDEELIRRQNPEADLRFQEW